MGKKSVRQNENRSMNDLRVRIISSFFIIVIQSRHPLTPKIINGHTQADAECKKSEREKKKNEGRERERKGE